MFQTKVVEKMKLTFYIPKYFSENCPVCEIMLKKYGRIGQVTDGNLTQRMHIACWISNAKNTHSEYVINAALPR